MTRIMRAGPLSFGGLVALSLLAAGCTSTRVDSIDTPPAPLPPAPSGTVTGNALPPPVSPSASTDFPAAPNTQVASLPPPNVPPASAPDVTAGSVAGVWGVSLSGQSCKIATPQTKFGQGFRAGPLRCPAPLDGVKSWNVAGKQLTLYDGDGNALAKLYSSAQDKFDGQTSSGQPISFSR